MLVWYYCTFKVCNELRLILKNWQAIAQKAKPYIINKVKHNVFFSVILDLNEAKVNIVNQILSFQKLYEMNCLSHLYRCCCTTFSPVKSRMQQYGCNRGSLSWLVTGWSPAGIWQTKRCVRLQTEGKLSSFRPNQCQRWLKWICLSPWGTTELQWGGGGAAPGASGDTHALPAVRRPCLYKYSFFLLASNSTCINITQIESKMTNFTKILHQSLLKKNHVTC